MKDEPPMRLVGMMRMAMHACQIDKACGDDETVAREELVKLMRVMMLIR